MKSVTRRRFLAGAKSGLVGLKPRPAAVPEDTAARAARLGYRLSWFVVGTETLSDRSQEMYAFGAVCNFPPAVPASAVVATLVYDAGVAGAVTTFTYDTAGRLVSVTDSGAPGLASSWAEGVGQVTTYSYDSNGQLFREEWEE